MLLCKILYLSSFDLGQDTTFGPAVLLCQHIRVSYGKSQRFERCVRSGWRVVGAGSRLDPRTRAQSPIVANDEIAG